MPVLLCGAGNSGVYYGTTIPAQCADAMAVTALTSSSSPASFSNYAYGSSPQTMRDRTIAAPGACLASAGVYHLSARLKRLISC